MIEQHRRTGATLSISLHRVEDPWHFGVVGVDEAMRIERFVEKPAQGEEPSNLINAGTWLWEPDVLDRIPDDDSAIRDGFSERVLFPGVIADGQRVQGFEEGLWVDVGSPDRYLRANRLLLERQTKQMSRSVIFEGDVRAEGAEFVGDVLVGAGTRIGQGARITGPTVIGRDTIIGAGAMIEASVIWEEAQIGDGARVSGSILGAYAGIGARAVVVEAVLGNGAEVEEGHALEPGARVMPEDRV